MGLSATDGARTAPRSGGAQAGLSASTLGVSLLKSVPASWLASAVTRVRPRLPPRRPRVRGSDDARSDAYTLLPPRPCGPKRCEALVTERLPADGARRARARPGRILRSRGGRRRVRPGPAGALGARG